jgi:dephospho-CoA kinase
MFKNKVVGVAGLPRSGKDSLAEYFVGQGYCAIGLGEIIRAESRLRHADKPDPISVKNMSETASWLRMKHGADYALNRALQEFNEIKDKKDCVGLLIVSVRAPVEVDFILAHGGELIWVEASDEVRYERNMSALRHGEKHDLDLDTFLKHESVQWKPRPELPIEAQMNMTYVKEKATIVLENNGNDIKGFVDKVRQVYDRVTLAKKTLKD